MKPTGKAKGGHARAAKLSQAKRKAIAKKGAAARWGKKSLNVGKIKLEMPPAKGRNPLESNLFEAVNANYTPPLRDQIAAAVLTGLYSNIADAQKFINYVFPGVPLPEALTRIAYEQADEVIRLRAL